jgi:hypothetical protein
MRAFVAQKAMVDHDAEVKPQDHPAAVIETTWPQGRTSPRRYICQSVQRTLP